MRALKLDANLQWLFTEVPFQERFDRAAAAGFEGVEFPEIDVLPLPELSRRLTDSGLSLVLMNTPAGDPGGEGRAGWACVPGAEREFQDSFLAALDAAVTLGARVVHVRAGIRNRSVDRRTALDIVADRLAWAATTAQGSGVLPVLEPQNQRDVPGHALESFDDAVAIIESIGRKTVGLLLDVYHLHMMGDDVLARIPALLPVTGHVQIADPPSRGEPGTGVFDWKRIFDLLRDREYAGWIGCEYRPSAETTLSLAWRDAFGLTATTETERLGLR